MRFDPERLDVQRKTATSRSWLAVRSSASRSYRSPKRGRFFVATGLPTAGEPEGDLAEMRRLSTDEAVLAMMPRVAPV
jgi:hypothetical protein